MSVILRNDFGAIAVNKRVIEQMIVEDMLAMPDVLVLSTKKGKPVKDRPTPFIDPDYFDAVEVSDKKGQVNVKVYVVIKSGNNISESADRIFEVIEKDFAMLKMEKPDTIKVKVRGIMSDEVIRKNIDIVRSNA